ncbi:hypothetical protein BCR33DRAFT_737503 [Rhizoclosmatium globosum]|uniref:Uncharacterized protein n=1 Tax=Rhizoclosmatium globosum TaxID=329046 RepID=A0A1Y2CDZ0_9FUNG|nr:hypothetical protein BCR33DRAFT_737503 [Rhizoclosmatium globosum]|eukprot:ORY45107.1 hypothetical protein BCR33DRAFT_737503 [Rhizoclosmatium globosum]
MSVFGRSFGSSSTPETPPVFGGDEDEILDVRADRFSSRNIEGCRFEEVCLCYSIGCTTTQPLDQLKAARESLKQEYIRSGKILADGAQVSLENAIQMTGECLDMCPEFERHERWFQDNLADPFELVRVGLV